MFSYCIEIDKTPDLGHTINITQTACFRLKVWHKYIVHVQNIDARPTPACRWPGGRLLIRGRGGVWSKRVSLVLFFWQVDSISIKGTYPGYKKENLKKNAF